MLERYRGAKNKVFLSGADAYALRCAYVHEGGGKVLYHRAREAVAHFYLVAPPSEDGIGVHNCLAEDTLILQVNIFCRDMIDAVGRWSNDVRSDQAVQQRLQSLLEIHDMTDGLTLLAWPSKALR